DLDAARRQVRIGDQWVALTHWGRPLQENWVMGLVFDSTGALHRIESTPDARRLLAFAGEFAVVFAPDGPRLRTLGLRNAPAAGPSFAVGRIGSAEFRVIAGRETVHLGADEVRTLAHLDNGTAPDHPRAPAIRGRVVAHAMGGLNGETYLNCRECFDDAY